MVASVSRSSISPGNGRIDQPVADPGERRLADRQGRELLAMLLQRLGKIGETDDESAGHDAVEAAGGNGSGDGAGGRLGRLPPAALAGLERAAERLRLILARRVHLVLEAAEPFVAVEAGERLVADRLRMLDQALAKACAGLGRGEGLGGQLVAPEAFDQRLGRREDGFEGVAAAVADDVVGILACGKLDEAQRAFGREEGKGAGGGADRGLLAGAVAVEAEDRVRDRAATCARAAPR